MATTSTIPTPIPTSTIPTPTSTPTSTPTTPIPIPTTPIDKFYNPLFYKEKDEDYSMFDKKIILSLLDIVLNNFYYKEHEQFGEKLNTVNKQIEEFNTDVEKYNGAVEIFNTKVEPINKLSDDEYKQLKETLDTEFNDLNTKLDDLEERYRLLNIERATTILEVLNSKITTEGLKLDTLSILDINTLNFEVTDNIIALIIKYGISTPVLQKLCDVQLLKKKPTNVYIKNILIDGNYKKLYNDTTIVEIKISIEKVTELNKYLIDNIDKLGDSQLSNLIKKLIPTPESIVTFDLYQIVSLKKFEDLYNAKTTLPEINKKYNVLVNEIKECINIKYNILNMLVSNFVNASSYVHYNYKDIDKSTLDPVTVNQNNKQLLKDYLQNVAEFFRFYDSCHDFSNPPGPTSRTSYPLDAKTLYQYFDFPILENKELDNRLYSFMCGILNLKLPSRNNEVIINTDRYKTDGLARYYSQDHMSTIFSRDKLNKLIKPSDSSKYTFSVDNKIDGKPLPLLDKISIPTQSDKFDIITNKYNLYGGTAGGAPVPLGTAPPARFVPLHLRPGAPTTPTTPGPPGPLGPGPLGPGLYRPSRPYTSAPSRPYIPAPTTPRPAPGPRSRVTATSTGPATYTSLGDTTGIITGDFYIDSCFSIFKNKTDPSYDCAYEHHNKLYYTQIGEIFNAIKNGEKIMFYYEDVLLSNGSKYKIQYNLINYSTDKKDILTINQNEIIYDINIQNLNSSDGYSLNSAYPQFTLKKVSELINTLDTSNFENFFKGIYINKIYSNASTSRLLDNVISINYNYDCSKYTCTNSKKIFTRFLLSNKRMGDWGQVEISRYLAHYQKQKKLTYSHLNYVNTKNYYKTDITSDYIYTVHKTEDAKTYFSTADNPCFMFSVAFGNLNTNYANVNLGNIIVNYADPDPTAPTTTLSQTLPNKHKIVSITNYNRPQKLTIVTKPTGQEEPTESKDMVDSVLEKLPEENIDIKPDTDYDNQNDIIKGFVDDLFNDIINKIKENKENASSNESGSSSGISLDGSNSDIITDNLSDDKQKHKKTIFEKVKSVFNLGITKIGNYIKINFPKKSSENNKYLLKGGNGNETTDKEPNFEESTDEELTKISVEELTREKSIEELIECYNYLYYTDNQQRDLLYLLFDNDDYSYTNDCISTILLSYFNILYFKLDGEITSDNYKCISTADYLTEDYYPVLNNIQKAIRDGKNLFEDEIIKKFLTKCYEKNIYFVPTENLYTFLKNIIIDNANEQLSTIKDVEELEKTINEEIKKQIQYPSLFDNRNQLTRIKTKPETPRGSNANKYIRNPNDEYYKNKYLKYKSKYLELKKN